MLAATAVFEHQGRIDDEIQLAKKHRNLAYGIGVSGLILGLLRFFM